MYFLKKILKNKNKPFYGKKANEAYEQLFVFDDKEILKNNAKETLCGIIQEHRSGNENVASAIYKNDYFKHIGKDGRVTEFKIQNIPNNRLLNSKNKVFDLCNKNFDEILKLKSTKQSFLKEKGTRITFLTSNGVYFKEGQFVDFNKGKLLPHISTLFLNMAISLDQNSAHKIVMKELKNCS